MQTIIFHHWVSMANSAIQGDTEAAELIKKAYSDLMAEIKAGTAYKEYHKSEIIFLSILCEGLSGEEKEYPNNNPTPFYFKGEAL